MAYTVVCQWFFLYACTITKIRVLDGTNVPNLLGSKRQLRPVLSEGIIINEKNRSICIRIMRSHARI
jgi:hypothetical protein